jgi:hypothetical protein
MKYLLARLLLTRLIDERQAGQHPKSLCILDYACIYLFTIVVADSLNV